MYLKLALRNAKRSLSDYILYILGVVMLTSVICISNCIANWGNMQGFQTMALPLLIVIIMVILMNYINTFAVKQRAKEFATYMLLGMEKSKLSSVFLCELSLIGLICFLLGTALGTGIFFAYHRMALHEAGGRFMPEIMTIGVLRTFAYFCCVEILSILFIRRKIYRLQIIQLMHEKRRNQPLMADGKSFWGLALIVSFSVYLTLLSGIAFIPGKIMFGSISFISLPVLLSIFSFYKWLYASIASWRLSQAENLYQGNRLYRIAEMTVHVKTSVRINTVFCICLVFSASSFVFGTLLLHPDVHVFENAKQQWMGSLQISICLIFMVIYFSILALLQMIDKRRETRNIRLLFHMGKNRSELKALIRTQTLIKLFLPTLMAFVILLTAAPFVNYKMNCLLPASMCNFTLKAIVLFGVCFGSLYTCYFWVIYTANTRHAKSNTK